MHPDQKAARIFGALFLLTFVTSIAGVLLYGPVLDEKDYILSGGADDRIVLGALMEIGLVITAIGTAVVLFPIARRYSETLAISFVASRIVESTIIAVGAISLLSILTLGQESAGDQGALLVQGEALVAIHDWTFLFGPGFCVGVGNGIILGYLMYKSGLVPRRLAMLGLIGGPLILIRATLISFGVVDHGDATDILAAPEILWELSLGLYPLIKGFKTPPAPVADDWRLRTGEGTRTAAATSG
jgi:Domain of unknown function (DUF4386)/Helicase associated domain (HA2)